MEKPDINKYIQTTQNPLAQDENVVEEFKLSENLWFNGRYIKIETAKEFIKWVKDELIMKSPDKRMNLIKLRKRVGDKLLDAKNTEGVK